METLALNFGHWVTKSVFLTHTKLLNNWRPKDNFCFDPISDRQEKKHLVSNNFCTPIFVLLFLYFKSRGQISRVRCAVVTRLPASEKLVPSTLRWLNRVMQDHEACARDLNRKLIFSFFLLFSQSKLLKHNKQGPKFAVQQSPLISRLLVSN